jgi:hypothetical protein
MNKIRSLIHPRRPSADKLAESLTDISQDMAAAKDVLCELVIQMQEADEKHGHG